MVDVSGTTDEQRAALGAAMGADTFSFVQALYVIDVFQRGRIALERFFDAPYGPAPDPTSGDLWATLEEFMRVVALDTALDPVTTELVRLRGALRTRLPHLPVAPEPEGGRVGRRRGAVRRRRRRRRRSPNASERHWRSPTQ